MNKSDMLKLAAIDEEDLAVLSTHAQDAVFKVADMVYLPVENRFAVAMNRFHWAAADASRTEFERRRAALVFDRVQSVRTSHIDRDNPDGVLELLAIKFNATESPGGKIDLIFAGDGCVQLDVECIEGRLTDLGAAWSTTSQPHHDVADT